MNRTALLLVVLAMTACMSSEAASRFRALPAGEQDAWNSCYSIVRGRNCGQGMGTDGIPADICMTDIAERYAFLNTPTARRETLVALGCPAPIVDAAISSR